jgi:uncharacterized membrane protein YkoI
MRKHLTTCLTATALVAAGFAGAALAKDMDRGHEDQAEHQAFSAAQVSLSDAIRVAESETGARAISAEFEDEDGDYVYAVELLGAGGTEYEVLVATSTPTVIKSESENDDEEDDQED